MRKFYSIFALCAFLFLSLAVQAEVLLNEHFNQTTETLATNENVLGYEIASIGWTNISGTGGIYLSSTDLTYSGYKSATDETGSAEFKTNKVRKVAAPLAKSINSGSVYVAAILNLEDYSTTSATASLLRSAHSTSAPAFSKFFAIGLPIMPSPMNPTFMASPSFPFRGHSFLSLPFFPAVKERTSYSEYRYTDCY